MKAASINQLWGRLLVDELVRCGVEYFVLTPGSRSAPLALAVADNDRCKKAVHFDERGAAFHALGYAKATGRPACVICTSGTAAANFYPAIVEASMAGVPLMVLTADRPPELRDSGSSQTIDQVKLYGDYVRWFVDLPTPTTDVAPQFLLTTIDQAVAKSTGIDPGPVHLNCMFREPLAPLGKEQDFSAYVSLLQGWLDGQAPFTSYSQGKLQADNQTLDRLAGMIATAKCGILVSGPGPMAGGQREIVDLAEKIQWPILADLGSQLRSSGRQSESIISHFDLYLRSEAISRRLQPDLIIQFGNFPLSKAANQYLVSSDADWVVVSAGRNRLDPAHCVTTRVTADPALLAGELQRRVELNRSRLMAPYRVLEELVTETLEVSVGSKSTELHELTVVASAMKTATAVYLAASMPMRLAEMVVPATGQLAPIQANRGVNGIDGTIATAIGFARGADSQTTLLIGDLALLHDLNSLAMLRSCPQPLVIVCLNNDGGGIFSHLPIAQVEEHFEKCFGTPHGLSFRAAAELFGIKYHEPKTPRDFGTVYRAAIKSRKPALIEVRTTRSLEVEWLRKLWIRLEEKALRRLDEFVNS